MLNINTDIIKFENASNYSLKMFKEKWQPVDLINIALKFKLKT